MPFRAIVAAGLVRLLNENTIACTEFTSQHVSKMDDGLAAMVDKRSSIFLCIHLQMLGGEGNMLVSRERRFQ